MTAPTEEQHYDVFIAHLDVAIEEYPEQTDETFMFPVADLISDLMRVQTSVRQANLKRFVAIERQPNPHWRLYLYHQQKELAAKHMDELKAMDPELYETSGARMAALLDALLAIPTSVRRQRGAELQSAAEWLVERIMNPSTDKEAN